MESFPLNHLASTLLPTQRRKYPFNSFIRRTRELALYCTNECSIHADKRIALIYSLPIVSSIVRQNAQQADDAVQWRSIFLHDIVRGIDAIFFFFHFTAACKKNNQAIVF